MSARSVTLDIQGMTCASCANRIERKLNKLDGVEASVNYATERAQVRFVPAVNTEQLLRIVSAAGYAATLHQDAPAKTEPSLAPRLVVALALSVPVLALSMVPGWQFAGWGWVVFALATPVVLWCGAPFHRATLANARHGASTMDTLVSLGTLAAYVWSAVALVTGRGHLYLETAAGVTAFLLLGRWLEARAKRRAGTALRSLLTLGAKEVVVLRDGREERSPIAELTVGDRFLVRPGEKVATDGVVEDGSSAVDRSLLTGESMPVDVGPGDEVTGATINTTGRLVVRAIRVGADTQLAQLGRLVEQAQSGKAPVQRLADRVSAVFVPVVLVLALLTLAGWLVTGHSAGAAFTAAVAVLVVACPCALGLATPTALLVGTGRGAQLGIVIKGPEVLEETRRVDTVVLDKTGTLTTGRMRLVGDPDPALLRLAAAVESHSTHPIARAIAEPRVLARRTATPGPSSRELWPAEPRVVDFVETPGVGVRGVVDGQLVEVRRGATSGAHTVVDVHVDGLRRGSLTIADTLKPTSAIAVRRLRDLGLTPVLLTGDQASAAHEVARQVGIDQVHAEVLPADKVDVVRRLQDQGRVVAMVGDGVNDAAALARADLGIAMGTGSDVAIEASDLTIVGGDLAKAADAIRLSRRTLATIKGNLFWAFAYNVAGIPLAMLGLLDPMWAGAAMAFSSVFVVTNSLRLRRFRAIG